MYNLLTRYFAGVTRTRFEQDLAEKDWVILLEAGSEIVGFSTLKFTRTTIDGQPVIAVFSGDTIVARESWGESELPRLWIRHVLSVTAGEQARVFWFLISSGYKTYRFLPVFFREFYPVFDRETPAWVKRLTDQLAADKFGDQYDAAAGVVRFREATPLQEGVAEVTERRLKDPHVAFFVRANPGHAVGDELVCLCELTPANLTAAGRRMLGLPSCG
ncbi:MAG TPA: hypothetical protein VNT75_03695 [Symbiobacteriaceae bacterium]|nr:hypothetical protein [Symbiobacteriaceae bacterium]